MPFADDFGGEFEAPLITGDDDTSMFFLSSICIEILNSVLISPRINPKPKIGKSDNPQGTVDFCPTAEYSICVSNKQPALQSPYFEKSG
jgi:hypothetical protein